MVTLREPQVGDLGLVISRQAALYAQEYGWNQQFEGLLAQIVGRFVAEFVPGRERCWIAEEQGRIVGSVFVVQQDAQTAKLRMLYVEPEMRGQGLGRRLVNECIGFAQAQGYQRISLWTNDILHAARHIYVQAGFELQSQERHSSFGGEQVGQEWLLVLTKTQAVTSAPHD